MKTYKKLSLQEIRVIEKIYDYHFPEQFIQLFPVFAHRYIPVINHRKPPVLSIHGSDVIYYGKNYKQYIRKEKENNFLDIRFNIKQYLYVPFWTDIM